MFKKSVEKPDDNLRSETFVGKTFSVLGMIKGEGNIQLDGCVEGDVVTKGDVVVNQDGKVCGMIEANNITIAGFVEGDVCAKGNLEIKETGILTGNAKTGTITIETNGTFLGKCEMNLPAGKELRGKGIDQEEDTINEQGLEQAVEQASAEKKTPSVFRNLSHLEEICRKSIRGLGVVRYSAFEDTGGDLSFSIAMLDGYKDGFVISSIFGKDDCRVYAKPLNRGKSSYKLSEEENRALEVALKGVPLT